MNRDGSSAYPKTLVAGVGRRLARGLRAYSYDPKAVVLGVSRSGVGLALELARRLFLPVDVLLLERVAGTSVLSEDGYLTGLPEADDGLDVEAARCRLLERRIGLRHSLPRRKLKNRTAVLVDDAAVTGLTMLAAVQAVCRQNVSGLVVAVPVGCKKALERISWFADRLVCLRRVGRMSPQWDGALRLEEDSVTEAMQAWNDTYRRRRCGMRHTRAQ